LADLPWTVRGETLIVTLRLTPRSSRDDIEGLAQLADGRSVLQARVRAVPESGAANEALLRLLAKKLHVPQRSVHLESGATARVKTVAVTGDSKALQAELSRLAGLD
jgi:uncharacterized protein (TIGR00251 family)